MVVVIGVPQNFDTGSMCVLKIIHVKWVLVGIRGFD